MFKSLLAFIESFIPESHRKDPEFLRRGRIFVWIYSSGIPLVTLLFLVEWLTGNLVNPSLAIGFVFFFIAMLVAFKKGVSASLLNNIIMLIVYLAFIVGAMELGGLRGANMPFIILFPQVSMLLSNRASGIFWLAVSGFVISAFYFIGKTEYAHLIKEPILSNDSMMFGFLLSALFFIFGMLWISETSRIRNLQLLNDEKKRSDDLLKNILPEEVAEELKAEGHSDAKHYDEVTVLFSDFKGFTRIAETLTAQELVKEINACFSAFDEICDKHKIEKIKTIGDAYMAAGGLPVENKTHAEDVVLAALEMRDFMKNRPFEIRIGVHTGNVVAGIVGIRKFQYDIWGDTVNTASRMESSSEAGKINISETTHQLVKDRFTCEFRGEIEAKGKGKMRMYFIEVTSSA